MATSKALHYSIENGYYQSEYEQQRYDYDAESHDDIRIALLYECLSLLPLFSPRPLLGRVKLTKETILLAGLHLSPLQHWLTITLLNDVPTIRNGLQWIYLYPQVN